MESAAAGYGLATELATVVRRLHTASHTVPAVCSGTSGLFGGGGAFLQGALQTLPGLRRERWRFVDRRSDAWLWGRAT